ncbi:hypothetical protein PL321_18445 [Caloramator sp. mosi_1]|uniref:hypothetical protein n=1 Tax=Caloramator sp. mosi_1 TaxID=3023090 RepID=UPI00236163F6|nr:hypothetical protein [Caloramator sp. mosi_1]WDC84196.1 hypothetical protein PL321_18445 [Caloramator sp. mosi_1]
MILRRVFKFNEEKKVLQVVGSLRIGGAENVAMNILRYIDKDKFSIDFLVFDNYTEKAMKKRLKS